MHPTAALGTATGLVAPGRRAGTLAQTRIFRAMNIVVGAIIVIVVTALTCTAMLFVRRRAPEGSFFTDGDRASGVFGVLATGFSVLLGFIIFLAFDSYDQARSGAETEATIVAQQLETAQFFPTDTAQAAQRRARLLRPVGGPHRVAGDGGRLARRDREPLGREDVPHAAGLHAGQRHRAVRVRPVDGPDGQPRAGPGRPGARRRGADPVPALARALRHLRRDLRVHALLRRQWRVTPRRR